VGEGYISQLILDSKRLDHTMKKRDSMDFSEIAGGTVKKPSVSKKSTPLRDRNLNLKLRLGGADDGRFRINSAQISARTIYSERSKLTMPQSDHHNLKLSGVASQEFVETTECDDFLHPKHNR